MQFGVNSMSTSFFAQSQLLRMPAPNVIVAALVCSQVYERFVYGSTRISGKECIRGDFGLEEWWEGNLCRQGMACLCDRRGTSKGLLSESGHAVSKDAVWMRGAWLMLYWYIWVE